MNKLTYTNACDDDNSIAGSPWNRHKGNDNLESGDWAIACVQVDRRIEPSLMRMTTFSPFQYQVQFKLMIQISDSISSYTTTTALLFVANLPIVILFPFGGSVTQCHYLINAEMENDDALFITQIWTTNSNNWDSEWKHIVSINFGRTHIPKAYNVDVHCEKRHI